MQKGYTLVAAMLASQLVATPVLAEGPPAGGQRMGMAKATLVETIEVAEHTVNQSLSLVGKLDASQSVVVSPESSGRIEQILVTHNQAVSAGDVLVVLDTTKADIAMQEAKLSLAEEQRVYSEYERLAEKKNITQTALAGQKAKVDIAEVRLASAQTDWNDRHIKAPFDGTTGFIDFSRGKMVSTNTELFTIDDLSVMYLDVHVPEKYLQQLNQNITAVATSQAWPGVEFAGKLTAVDTRINPETLNMTARIQFANSDTKLKPGMLMNVELAFDPIVEPIIPVQSIEYSGSKRYVYVATADNKARRTEVTLGTRIDDQVVVTSGLEIGDRVVFKGTVNLRDGAVIRDVGEASQASQIKGQTPERIKGQTPNRQASTAANAGQGEG